MRSKRRSPKERRGERRFLARDVEPLADEAGLERVQLDGVRRVAAAARLVEEEARAGTDLEHRTARRAVPSDERQLMAGVESFERLDSEVPIGRDVRLIVVVEVDDRRGQRPRRDRDKPAPGAKPSLVAVLLDGHPVAGRAAQDAGDLLQGRLSFSRVQCRFSQ